MALQLTIGLKKYCVKWSIDQCYLCNHFRYTRKGFCGQTNAAAAAAFVAKITPTLFFLLAAIIIVLCCSLFQYLRFRAPYRVVVVFSLQGRADDFW